MRVYSYDHDGYLAGETVADESPLEKGVYLIPAHATPDAPPTCSENERVRFVDGVWTVEQVPQPEPEPEPPVIPFPEIREAYFDSTVRPLRERIIIRLNDIGGRLSRKTGAQPNILQVVDTAVEQLLNITKAPSVLVATTEQSLHDAVLIYYRAVAGQVIAAVPGLKTAFDEVDA